MGVSSKVSNSLSLLYYWPESNRHEHHCPRDFKSLVSTNFTTVASITTPICQRTFVPFFNISKIRNKFDSHKLYFQIFEIFFCGGRWTRTTEPVKELIYSQPQLPLCDTPFCGPGGIRTRVLIRKPNPSFTSLVHFS